MIPVVSGESALRGFDFPPPIQAIWNTPPHLSELEVRRGVDVEELTAKCAPHREVEPQSRGLFSRFGASVRANWDYLIFTKMSMTATPFIVLGLLAVVLGLGGCAASLSHASIPGLEFILEHMPISLIFSLCLIRGGLLLLNRGIINSRIDNRNRQEVQECYEAYRIKAFIEGDTPATRALLKEAIRMNERMATPLRLENPLDIAEVQGKQKKDLSFKQPIQYYKERVRDLLNWAEGAPEIAPTSVRARGLVPPEEIEVRHVPSHPKQGACWQRWYDWWLEKMPALGKLNIAIGHLMLFTAIAGLVVFCTPMHLPPGLDAVCHDPYLSMTFILILISNFFDCVYNGWRAQKYSDREKRRASLEEDLQLIECGLEKRKIEEFHAYLIEKIEGLRNKEALKDHLDDALDELKKSYPLLPPRREEEKEKAWLTSFVPKFATPAILLGVLIALSGITCLVFSFTGPPAALEFIATDTPLSILFSTALIMTGLNTLYAGAALSERLIKDKKKKIDGEKRRELLEELWKEAPPLLSPERREGVARNALEGTVVLNVAPPKRKQEFAPLAKGLEKLSRSWYGFWVTGLKQIWKPNLMMALFLFVSSLMGLCFSAGAPVPSYCHYIISDPSYSGAFCLSLLVISLNGFNATWRMGTYHKRKKRDHGYASVIEECYDKIFPSSAPPLSLHQRV